MPKFILKENSDAQIRNRASVPVPMYQHIAVEAESLEEARKKGISDDIDWDTQEMDGDGARKTTITGAKVVPDGYDVGPKTGVDRHPRRGRPFGSGPAQLRHVPLRERGRDGPAPRDPGAVHRRRIIRHTPSAAAEWARGVGAVSVATAAGPISC